jgi:RsiW-degrading membrane proteinase PrsW (M82 family)
VGDRYGTSARSAVFVAPWIEEAAKGAVIVLVAGWRGHRFAGPLAGAVYGGLVGIGFAFTENVVYYGQLFQQVDDYRDSRQAALRAVEQLFLWRGLAAPFVHPMFTMATGAAIGLAAQARSRGVRVVAPIAGFAVAVLLHMGYNAAASLAAGSAMTAVYLAGLLPLAASLVVGLLVLRRQEARLVAARPSDCAAFDLIPPDPVAAVVRSAARS